MPAHKTTPQTQARIIILMPVYEDVLACRILLRELETQFGSDCFVVVVDDGSRKQPLSASTFEGCALQGRILRLQRNVGHQHALAVGLKHIAGFMQPQQTLVIMDSDGEDQPQAIQGMYEHFSHGVDAVVAARGRRQEHLSFIGFYKAYRALFRLSTGRELDFGNFIALSASAVQTMTRQPTLPIHVAASLLMSGLNIERKTIDRGARYAGMSKMNLPSLIRHGLKAIAVFQPFLLRRLRLCTIALIGMTAVWLCLATLTDTKHEQPMSNFFSALAWTSSIGSALCLLVYPLLRIRTTLSPPAVDMELVQQEIELRHAFHPFNQRQATADH